jgi:2'-5' RNA ligase
MSVAPPRLFFALVPDENCLRYLEAQQNHLKRCGWQRYGKFSPEESLHLTIRFLGPVSEEVLPPLMEAVRDLGKESKPFDYEVGKPILFPRVSRAKVVAAQVAPNFRLKQLARALDQAAVAVGLPANNFPFRPHITLARLKGSASRPNLPSLGGQVSVPADRLVLFASDLTAEGPVYRELSSFTFGT